MAVKYCRPCRTWRNFNSLSYVDGSVAELCTQCGNGTIYHQCQSHAELGAIPNLHPIFESMLESSCPACMVIYQVSRQVEESHSTPSWAKDWASVIGVGALTLAFIMLGNTVIKAINTR